MKNEVVLVIVLVLVAAFVGVFMQVAPVRASTGTWDPTLGWDFECHTNAHPSLISLSNASIRAEYQAVNAAFEAHGYAPPEHTAYPYGDYNSRVERITAEYRKSGRTVWGNMMTYPVTNWFEVLAAQLVWNTVFSDIKGWVDSCEANNALLCIFTHDVSASPSEYGCTPAILTQMVDYLVKEQNAGKLAVMTIAQAYDYWSTTKSGKPTVVVSFDDAYESDYLVAYPLFVARGLKGTSYIVTSYIDGDGQLSWSEIAKMRASRNTYAAVRGNDNRIYYDVYNGSSWGSWTRLPGATCDCPAAAVFNNQLHIVVRGMDGYTLWHGYVNLADNTFNGWTLLSGSTPSAPAMASNGTVLCLVVRGLNNSTFYRYYNGSWSSWQVVPTGATCDTPAAALLGNDLHVVVRGMDGSSLWDIIVRCDGTVVRGWRSISGATSSRPALASSRSSGKLYLVVTGLDNRVYYRNYTDSTDSWGSWSALSGATIDGPAATVANDCIYIAVRGLDGNTLWHGYVDLETSSFSGWTLLSGATPSTPTLTS